MLGTILATFLIHKISIPSGTQFESTEPEAASGIFSVFSSSFPPSSMCFTVKFFISLTVSSY